VAIVCGVEPLNLSAWVPNQTQVGVYPTAGVGASDREACEILLREVVKAYDPAWAHLAIDMLPSAPVPPFDQGAPVVGWMTYVSRDYPPIPTVLPPGAVQYQLDSGVLVVAHPAEPDPVAMDAVHGALKEAGVLVPALMMRKQR